MVSSDFNFMMGRHMSKKILHNLIRSEARSKDFVDLSNWLRIQRQNSCTQ